MGVQGGPLYGRGKYCGRFGDVCAGAEARHEMPGKEPRLGYSSALDRAASPVKAAGDTTVNIYSPVAVDPIQAAREWKKTTQRLAMGF